MFHGANLITRWAAFFKRRRLVHTCYTLMNTCFFSGILYAAYFVSKGVFAFFWNILGLFENYLSAREVRVQEKIFQRSINISSNIMMTNQHRCVETWRRSRLRLPNTNMRI